MYSPLLRYLCWVLYGVVYIIFRIILFFLAKNISYGSLSSIIHLYHAVIHKSLEFLLWTDGRRHGYRLIHGGGVLWLLCRQGLGRPCEGGNHRSVHGRENLEGHFSRMDSRHPRRRHHEQDCGRNPQQFRSREPWVEYAFIYLHVRTPCMQSRRSIALESRPIFRFTASAAMIVWAYFSLSGRRVWLLYRLIPDLFGHLRHLLPRSRRGRYAGPCPSCFRKSSNVDFTTSDFNS